MDRYTLLAFFLGWRGTPCGLWGLRSQTRYQTRVPYSGSWGPNHWTTREFPLLAFENFDAESLLPHCKNVMGVFSPLWLCSFIPVIIIPTIYRVLTVCQALCFKYVVIRSNFGSKYYFISVLQRNKLKQRGISARSDS